MQLQDFLARATAAKVTPVGADVPGIGKVFMMPLTVGMVDEVHETPEGETERRGIVRGLARALCDEDGNRYGESAELVTALDGLSWESLKALRAQVEGDPKNA